MTLAPLTDDEAALCYHVMRFGSDGYPIRKLGARWIVDDWRSVKGAPTVHKTKRAAVAVPQFERGERRLRCATGRVRDGSEASDHRRGQARSHDANVRVRLRTDPRAPDPTYQVGSEDDLLGRGDHSLFRLTRSTGIRMLFFVMNKTSNSKRATIRYASAAEGKLYRVYGEDGELIVFDTEIEAVLEDGRRFYLTGYRVKGAVQGPEGMVPNYGYKDQVARMIERIESRGWIDLAYWTECAPGPTWEEREAYNLKCEAEERAWGLA